ncbi:MAG: dTDP-4-dehydrorhamnose reductase [Clostridia bacterium]|nr:MAG: dTDP-4-dehydrorhamnose reductase [Clostridia bacterium]
MRILVTGARGMLGTDVVAECLRRGHKVIALGHAELDITSGSAVKEALKDHHPAVVINCAAYTNVDGAEENRNLAMAVNALGVRNLALACRAVDAALVHMSTDYVFDGSKSGPWRIYDHRNPINAYGESKYLGECFIETVGGCYFIVRTSWLFGHNGPNFVETMLRLAQAGQSVTVVTDQRGCPTYTVDLATALLDLIETQAYGIYHITNRGATTWYEFAKAIFDFAGLKVNLSPTDSNQYKRPARRPTNSVLDPFPLEETIGYLLPPWQEALKRYLAQKGYQTA